MKCEKCGSKCYCDECDDFDDSYVSPPAKIVKTFKCLEESAFEKRETRIKELEAENTRLVAVAKAARELCEAIERWGQDSGVNAPMLDTEFIEDELLAVRERLG